VFSNVDAEVPPSDRAVAVWGPADSPGDRVGEFETGSRQDAVVVATYGLTAAAVGAATTVGGQGVAVISVSVIVSVTVLAVQDCSKYVSVKVTHVCGLLLVVDIMLLQ
jgi:hypothetical protein